MLLDTNQYCVMCGDQIEEDEGNDSINATTEQWREETKEHVFVCTTCDEMVDETCISLTGISKGYDNVW